MEVEKTGNCFIAATLSSLAGTSLAGTAQADILTGLGQLKDSTELLKRQLAVSASQLLVEDSQVRQKLLHLCNSSSEELVKYVGPYLDSLRTGAPDNQLRCHGLEKDKITFRAAPSHLREQAGPSPATNSRIRQNLEYIASTQIRLSLEDITIMLLSNCLQRNLLVFHKNPLCAAIIKLRWFGNESHEAPITILYDNKWDHFSGLRPRWAQMEDLSEFIIKESPPESISVSASELELKMSRFMTHKERD